MISSFLFPYFAVLHQNTCSITTVKKNYSQNKCFGSLYPFTRHYLIEIHTRSICTVNMIDMCLGSPLTTNKLGKCAAMLVDAAGTADLLPSSP